MCCGKRNCLKLTVIEKASGRHKLLVEDDYGGRAVLTQTEALRFTKTAASLFVKFLNKKNGVKPEPCKIRKAPKWMKRQRKRLRALPAPSVEVMKQMFSASANTPYPFSRKEVY